MSKKNKTISLRVNDELFAYIESESKKLDVSKSDFIVSAVLKKDTKVSKEVRERNFHLNKAVHLLEDISHNIKFGGSLSIVVLEQLIVIEKELKKS